MNQPETHSSHSVPRRPYQYYNATTSLCAVCLRRVEAKVVFAEGAVWMLKRCPEHGVQHVMIADDIPYYRWARERFITTAQQVKNYNTRSHYGCPYDCGICPDHEQHGCTLLLEITDACNLRCPTCYADSSPERQQYRPLSQLKRMLDLAEHNEGQPNIVQISGGEPTLHPDFLTIVDEAQSRPIQYLLINTNGVRLAKDEALVKALAERRQHLEIYLQFDSLKSEALQNLRGADLRQVHQQALALLNKYKIATNLVVTVRRGVNDDELGNLIEFARQQDCVRGITFQPVQAAGRLSNYPQGFQSERDRLTLTEVRRNIVQQSTLFQADDIIPVPCHPEQLAMAYALRSTPNSDSDPGTFVPLTRLIDIDTLLESAPNTVLYEQQAPLKDALLDLFSTHHSQESEQLAMQHLLHKIPQQNAIDYKHIFRVLIVEFMDAHNFDVHSIRKSCVHIIHPDAKRVIPFETYNLLYRDNLEKNILSPLRRQQAPMGGAISDRLAETFDVRDTLTNSEIYGDGNFDAKEGLNGETHSHSNGENRAHIIASSNNGT